MTRKIDRVANPPRLMNTRETATYLSTSEGTVGMLAQMPVDPLPSLILPNTKCRRFDIRQVDAWIDRQSERSAACA